ncbi:MAG: DNA methyltransferase [Candidatus Marinimicrobia bacterium]|jgi:DNA modification methylase|nr:DNA methyltransferase [Candidatus Neomarinimicrobiota bacterium]
MKQQVKRSKIKENPNNPRIIKDHKYYLLVKSLQEFPEMLKLRPIVVDEDMMVLGGNKRLKASKDAGLKEVWIEIAEGLTEAQKKEFVIKDNTNYGEWDWDILANEWDSVQLTEWGVDAWPNQDDIKVEPIAGLTDDDDVPEAEESICKAGDIWVLGNHRLLCGDATKKGDVERLMDGQKADMVFTDPPYGMNAVKNSGVLSKKYKDIINDDSINVAINSFELLDDDIPAIWWGANYYANILPNKPHWIVWDKNNGGSDQMDCELAWTNLKGVTRQFTLSSEKKNRVHPTQKPVELINWSLDKVKPQTVLDLFLGSGSTLIACEKTGRKCYGMEIDPHYCDVIVKRWEEFTGNKAEKLDGKTEKV